MKSLPPPPDIHIRQVDEIPPHIKLSDGRAKYSWLHQQVLALPPGRGGLVVTFPDRRLTELARLSVLKLMSKAGPAMIPPCKIQTWIIPVGDAVCELWIECQYLTDVPRPQTPPPSQNGHTQPPPGGATTYTDLHGKILSHTEMRELLRNRHVVPLEKFTSSRRGVMVVVDRNGKLVLEPEK
jgi:hypothetical protein